MIKVEAIQQFTLGKFNEIKNLTRKSANVDGMIFIGDTFECTQELAEYLCGKNALNRAVVQVIEVLPVKEEPKVEIKEEIVKPVKKTNKKKSSKK